MSMDRQQFNSISPSLLATVIMPAQQRMHALSAANPTDAESSIPLLKKTFDALN